MNMNLQWTWEEERVMDLRASLRTKLAVSEEHRGDGAKRPIVWKHKRYVYLSKGTHLLRTSVLFL